MRIDGVIKSWQRRGGAMHKEVFMITAVVGANWGDEGFRKHCRGCALKYLMRADKKNGLEDLKKAQQYLKWEIELRECAENKSAHEEKWEQKNAINIDGVALHP